MQEQQSAAADANSNAGGSHAEGAGESPAVRGRQVTIADVAPYAKRNHRACNGGGFFDQREITGEHLRTIPCACALNRFIKAQHHRIEILKTGDVHWLPGREPENAKA